MAMAIAMYAQSVEIGQLGSTTEQPAATVAKDFSGEVSAKITRIRAGKFFNH